MKQGRFSEEQIIAILKEAESRGEGHRVMSAARHLGRDLLYLAQQVWRAGESRRCAGCASSRKRTGG